MKLKIKNSLGLLAIVAAFTVVISSCNRGVGCPNNFSIDQCISPLIELTTQSMID